MEDKSVPDQTANWGVSPDRPLRETLLALPLGVV